MSTTIIELMQAFVAMSVFYVWVVRYQAVVADFAAFQLPDWLRDLVGALKLTGVALLLGIGDGLEGIGAALIGVFMVGAVMMHLRVKNPLIKVLPSFCLGLMALLITMNYYVL